MVRKRLKDVEIGSFFGQFASEQVVPRSHLLANPKEVIKWDMFNDVSIAVYKGLARLSVHRARRLFF